jgi:hypothetical protein
LLLHLRPPGGRVQEEAGRKSVRLLSACPSFEEAGIYHPVKKNTDTGQQRAARCSSGDILLNDKPISPRHGNDRMQTGVKYILDSHHL